MGTSVTQALVDAIGGEGNVVMTTGPLGFSAVQGRSKAFESVVKKFPKINVLDTAPADWDVTKTARIWETWLNKYPKIDAAFFHNDDMALAAYNVMKAHNRTSILIGGVDAMPPAIEAVLDGRMCATVRGSSARRHCRLTVRLFSFNLANLKMMTDQALVIRLNPSDDVVIALQEIQAGTPLPEEGFSGRT
jgi:ribose transport system substrate-binding protein